jgi:hypothetical protein
MRFVVVDVSLENKKVLAVHVKVLSVLHNGVVVALYLGQHLEATT